MADPQIENGYTPFANDLLEEIILRDFSKREFKVIFTIGRITYGWSQKTCKTNAAELAEVAGLDPGNMRKALKSLITAKVVTKRSLKGGYSLGINKDYDEWEILPRESSLARQNGGCRLVTLTKLDGQNDFPTIVNQIKARDGANTEKQNEKTPKPPMEKHKPFQFFSYWFYRQRLIHLEDKYYDPWDKRILKTAKTIIEKKAKGDVQEAKRRAEVLFRESRINDFYSFTLADLTRWWEKLIGSSATKPKKELAKI